MMIKKLNMILRPGESEEKCKLLRNSRDNLLMKM
jgi:hypothetical protein